LRLYFISDLHANLEAVQAVASQMGAGPVFCLGDIVGYGANPDEVVSWVKKRGVVCVLGNHDEAVLTGEVSWFNRHAAQAALWTRRVLSQESRAFLGALPATRIAEVEGLKILMAHGSPSDPLREYVDPSTHSDLFEFYLTKHKVDAVALGHTHVPYVWASKVGAVFNPGSVGQPRTGDPRASFATAEISGHQLSVDLHLTPYDIDTAAEKMQQAGLPPILWQRLYRGI